MNAADAFEPVRDLEYALCEYTGAPLAVAVNSCTMAILLACAWHRHLLDRCGAQSWQGVEIPKRTYVGVPMAIRHAGFAVDFRDEDWRGFYQLKPLDVWDCARLFTSGMYSYRDRRSMLCVSFHASKVLGDTQGGAILLDDPAAAAWLRRARFDGRTEGVAPKDDRFDFLGWHCYMSPDVAARLTWKLSRLPSHNEPLPNDDYPDLSTMEVFR